MQMLSRLWRYANIVFFKTYANLKSEVSKTYVGCLWWALEPIINTAVYYSVLTFLSSGRFEQGVVFIYIGTVFYGWFSSAINTGAVSVIANSGIIQQVYLPKILFPFITISNLSWKFLFSFLVLLPLLWFNHFGVHITYLALPFLFVLQYFAVIGISLPLAVLLPYFPDGKTVLAAFLNVFMWVSGVLYSGDAVPPKLRILFYMNPIAGLIESHRLVLIQGQWPHFFHLLPGLITSLAFWGIGLAAANKVDRRVTKIAM